MRLTSTPLRARGELVVADRRERQAVARAQQQHDGAEHADDQRERNPVDHELAHLPARRHRGDDPRRQADAGASAERATPAMRAAGTPRPRPRCRSRNSGRAGGTSGRRPAARPPPRSARRAASPRAVERRPGWRARTGDRRRARHRPAGRPTRGRHSPPAGSTGSRARHRRRSPRAAAGRRGRPRRAPRRARAARRRAPLMPTRLDAGRVLDVECGALIPAPSETGLAAAPPG